MWWFQNTSSLRSENENFWHKYTEQNRTETARNFPEEPAESEEASGEDRPGELIQAKQLTTAFCRWSDNLAFTATSHNSWRGAEIKTSERLKK